MTVETKKGAVPLHTLPTKADVSAMFYAEPLEQKLYEPNSEIYTLHVSSMPANSTPKEASSYVARQMLLIVERAILIAVRNVAPQTYAFRPPTPARIRLIATMKADLIKPFCTVTFATSINPVTGTPILVIRGLHARMNGDLLYPLQCAGFRREPYGPKHDWRVKLV